MAQELLTVGKMAKEWGVAPKEVKEAIKKLSLEPDEKKGACNYYYPQTVVKIKKSLKA